MRKSLYPLAVAALLLAGMLFLGSGCGGRKVAPTPPPAASSSNVPPEVRTTSPAPTISLTLTPAAIMKGQSSTLSWRSSNASEVTIDGGVGTVEASGSRTVAPADSMTYHAHATGPGGTADAEARVTVSNEATEVIPPVSRPVSDVEYFNDQKNIKDVFFDYDRYEIRDDARQALLTDARSLKERPNIRISIEGHCDERGSEAYNLALGDKRANAAKEFLVSQGIDPARIDTISYGEEKPFATGHDEASWSQNRRAHLVMR